jgi:hypothetical protein
LTCRACGHVWRGPGTDAFSFIVCNRAANVNPVQERRPGRPREPRFAVNLQVRYRTPDVPHWQTAVTENISRSGVLLRAERSLTPRTAVELVLQVPNPFAGGPAGDVTCVGDVVRDEPRNGGTPTHAVAVAVGNYRLSRPPTADAPSTS